MSHLGTELGKIKALGDPVNTFLDADFWLTDLKYQTGGEFKIGIKIQCPEGDHKLLGVIDWKYFAVALTMDFSEKATEQ